MDVEKIMNDHSITLDTLRMHFHSLVRNRNHISFKCELQRSMITTYVIHRYTLLMVSLGLHYVIWEWRRQEQLFAVVLRQASLVWIFFNSVDYTESFTYCTVTIKSILHFTISAWVTISLTPFTVLWLSDKFHALLSHIQGKYFIVYCLTRFKSCYSVSFTEWARCNSNGWHTELVGVVWEKMWNIARLWSTVLLEGLPHMWLDCSNVDDIVHNKTIPLISSWRIPWELHSHGVNRYSSSDPWRAGWNCEIMYKS